MRILASILLLIPSLYLGAQKDSLGTEPIDSNKLWFSDSMLTMLEEVNLEFQRIEGARGHRIEEDIDARSFQALNLAEGLKQNSALFVRSNGSNGVATLSVRGTSSSQSKVYWNGLDITPPNLALIDLSLLQSKPWESLEIDYGAGSLPLGSGSIGAALNLNTQWEGRGKRKAFLSLGMGSFGRQEFQGWAAYGKGKLRAQTSMSYSGINNDFQYRLPGENQR
ncbi:MAG: TonB-dependent receptor [Croceimicrobium sp.]